MKAEKSEYGKKQSGNEISPKGLAIMQAYLLCVSNSLKQ